MQFTISSPSLRRSSGTAPARYTFAVPKSSATKRLASLPIRKADFIVPMECAPVSKLIDGPGWIFEIKFDGYRAIAVKTDGGTNLYSRRHKFFNHQYPLIVEALAELPDGTVQVL